MALKEEAEQLRDLADKIVKAEIVKAQVVASGGVIYLDKEEGSQDLPVTLTVQQRQAALAVIAGWQTDAKAITAGW